MNQRSPEVMAWLHRYNLGFAKLQMVVKDLGFSEAVYGFGAGIVYFGYMLFESALTVN